MTPSTTPVEGVRGRGPLTREEPVPRLPQRRGGAMRRWRRSRSCALHGFFIVLARRRLRELQRCHRIASGDAPLQIGLPSDVLVDFRRRGALCRGTRLESGFKLVEEGLDRRIHRCQLRSRMPEAAGLHELRQIGAGEEGWCGLCYQMIAPARFTRLLTDSGSKSYYID